MMKRTLIAAAIAPMLVSLTLQAQTVAHTARLAYVVPAASYRPASTPPEAWQEQDPAVALYKQGRTELNSGNYDKAADIFGKIVSSYPRSTYAPDAYYWQAFALYKASDFDEARDVLTQQQRRYPKAATAREGAGLLAQINAQLARQGDAQAAHDVTVKANGAAQGCPRDDDDDDIRITALNSVLTMNAEQAIPLLKQVLAKRDACSAALRRKAVFLISQKR